MLANLYDQENGGFYSSVPDETAAIIPPRKPLELNAVGPTSSTTCGSIPGNGAYAAVPEATIRAVATPEILRREGRITGQTR